MTNAQTLATKVDDARYGVERAERMFSVAMFETVLGDHGVKPAQVRDVLVRDKGWKVNAKGQCKTWDNYVSAVRNLGRAAKLNGFDVTPLGVEQYCDWMNDDQDVAIWSLQNLAKRFGAAALKRAKVEDAAESDAPAESAPAESDAAESVADKVAAVEAIMRSMSVEERELVILSAQSMNDAVARTAVSI